MTLPFSVQSGLTRRTFPCDIRRWDGTDVDGYMESVQPYALGPSPVAVPTSFGNIVGRGEIPVTAFGDYPVSAVVHAQQSLEVLQPLASSGTLRVDTRIPWVRATANGTFIGIETESSDADTGSTKLRINRTIYVKGAKGRNEGTLPAPDDWAPEKDQPDVTVVCQIARNQAVRFSGNGDDNPVHLDPTVARARGFDRPILHGLCTLGIVEHLASMRGVALLPGPTRRLEGRFEDVVYPGDALRMEAWRSSDGIRFQVSSGGRIVVSRGRMVV